MSGDTAGRDRRAFAVWESASASVERHARLLGLERRQKAITERWPTSKAGGTRCESHPWSRAHNR